MTILWMIRAVQILSWMFYVEIIIIIKRRWFDSSHGAVTFHETFNNIVQKTLTTEYIFIQWTSNQT
jgi:hypothetical protein